MRPSGEERGGCKEEDKEGEEQVDSIMRLLVSTRNASIKMTTMTTCYQSCCGDCNDGGVGGGADGGGGC